MCLLLLPIFMDSVLEVYSQQLSSRSSPSTMYALNYIDIFEFLVRKHVVGFTERLKVSKNSIINCIDNS